MFRYISVPRSEMFVQQEVRMHDGTHPAIEHEIFVCSIVRCNFFTNTVIPVPFAAFCAAVRVTFTVVDLSDLTEFVTHEWPLAHKFDL